MSSPPPSAAASAESRPSTTGAAPPRRRAGSDLDRVGAGLRHLGLDLPRHPDRGRVAAAARLGRRRGSPLAGLRAGGRPAAAARPRRAARGPAATRLRRARRRAAAGRRQRPGRARRVRPPGEACRRVSPRCWSPPCRCWWCCSVRPPATGRASAPFAGVLLGLRRPGPAVPARTRRRRTPFRSPVRSPWSRRPSCWSVGSFLVRTAADAGRPVRGQRLRDGSPARRCWLVVAAGRGEPRGLDPAAVSTRSWLALAYLIVSGSLVAFTAYVWLLHHAPISLVARTRT